MEKLKEGLRYNYKGDNIIIQRVKKVNGNTVITTNRRSYNLLPSEVEEFEHNLTEWKEKEVEVLSTEDFDVKEILIEAISKIRADENYIKQANAICNVVSQMINIKKLELQIKK
jgi:hypothetical protein